MNPITLDTIYEAFSDVQESYIAFNKAREDLLKLYGSTDYVFLRDSGPDLFDILRNLQKLQEKVDELRRIGAAEEGRARKIIASCRLNLDKLVRAPFGDEDLTYSWANFVLWVNKVVNEMRSKDSNTRPVPLCGACTKVKSAIAKCEKMKDGNEKDVLKNLEELMENLIGSLWLMKTLVKKI